MNSNQNVRERYEGAFNISMISYIWVVVGLAISFVLSDDITTKTILNQYRGTAIYFSLLCITSTLGIIYIDIYLTLKRRSVKTPDGYKKAVLRLQCLHEAKLMTEHETKLDHTKLDETTKQHQTKHHETKVDQTKLDERKIDKTKENETNLHARSVDVIPVDVIKVKPDDTKRDVELVGIKKKQSKQDAPKPDVTKQDEGKKQVEVKDASVSPEDICDTGVTSMTDITGYYTNVSKGINFYFLLGGVGFGVGSAVLSVITLVTIKPGCLNVYSVSEDSTHLILTLTEIVFVIRRHKTVILRSNLLCRFIIVHVIATNLSYWIILSFSEAIEFYHSDILQQLLLAGNLTNYAHCHKSPVSHEASMILVPCMIEHSLFVIPILFSMYTKMADSTLNIIKPNTKRSLAKIWTNIKRVGTGLVVFGLTIMSEVSFFYVLNRYEDEETSQLIFISTQIVLNVIVIVSICRVFHIFTGLGFDRLRPRSFDEQLLTFSAGGYMFFNICRILPAIRGIEGEESAISTLILVSAVGSVIHGLLQTTFITVALRSHALTDEHRRKKPGRSFIGFLVMSNLSMWITVTFEIRKSTAVLIYTSFYGQLPWLLCTFGSIPLVIFYLFHSTVCLSDIWKEAYE